MRGPPTTFISKIKDQSPYSGESYYDDPTQVLKQPKDDLEDHFAPKPNKPEQDSDKKQQGPTRKKRKKHTTLIKSYKMIAKSQDNSHTGLTE